MSLAAMSGPAHAAVVTLSVSAPGGNETFSGGSPHDIVWFMDTDSGNPGLLVDFEYLLDGVPTTIATGINYPPTTTNTRSWDVPVIDHTNVTVRVCASDIAGGSACNTTAAFRIDATRPEILSASPVGTNVGPFEELVVDFSELMNDTSLPPAFSIAPFVTGINIMTYKSTSTTTAMRVNHSAFETGRNYTVTISCSALDRSDPGNPPITCPSPTSWNFRTATPPGVAWTSPAAGDRWTGGTDHELRWAASDAEDPASSLSVYLDFTTDGSTWTPIAGPLPGDASHVWTVPSLDAVSARVRARVVDTRGLEAPATSPPFAIDSTAPTVAATTPADAQTGVGWLTPVLITFSEPMDVAANAETVSVRSGAGAYVPGTVSWDSPQVVRFSPAAAYRASTLYVARINITANDASDPGNALSAPFEFTFLTQSNAGPSVTFATAPTGTVSGGSTWVLSWTATDPEDPPANLRIDVEFSDGGAFAPIAGPLGPTNTFSFDVPPLDTTLAALRVRLTDSQGGVATDLAPFAVDSTPPSVASVDPAPDATDVSPTAQILITFSEPVDATGGAALRRLGGAWVPTVASWDDPTTLRLTPVAPFREFVDHEIVVNMTVRDLSVPGNALTSYAAQFRVAAIPPTLAITSPTPGTRWTAGTTQTLVVTAADGQDPQVALTLAVALDGITFVPLLSTTMANGVGTFPVPVPAWDAPNGALRICVADGVGANTCATMAVVLDAQAPRVLTLSPVPGTVVHPEDPLAISFSESMSPAATAAFTLAPAAPLTFRWTRTEFDNDTLIVEHPRLLELRAYTASFACSARDASLPGLGLGGACPLAWTFTTAATPSVRLLYPAGGERLTGGALHTIRWVSADEESTLSTRVELSLDGGSTWTRLDDLTPFPMGDTKVPRVLPAFDTANAVVRVTAWDSWGLNATATSGAFAIDATLPTILSATPADGGTGISPLADIVLVFSESMDLASLPPALTSAPAMRDVVFAWGSTNAPFDTVRVQHAPIRLGVGVRLAVDGARDASTPGNAMTGGLQFTIAPDLEQPSIRILVDADVEEGDVIVLDATDSSDNDEIVSYSWTVTDDRGRPVARLQGPRVEYRANDPGRLNVTVEVYDAAGNKAFARADVDVHTLGSIVTEVPFPPDPMLGWVALAGGASSTAWSLTDRGRSFLSRMILLPLYVKTRGAAVLDNELRGMIRGYVLVNPGDCYTDIKRNLQLENGELAYHLSVLEREGIIKTSTKGAKRMYYPADMPTPENGDGLHEIQERILKHVRDVPGMSAPDLGSVLGVSTQLALYHMRKLGEMGYLRFERSRMQYRVYATTEAERTRLQRRLGNA